MAVVAGATGTVAAGATSRPHMRRRLWLVTSPPNDGGIVSQSSTRVEDSVFKGKGASGEVMRESRRVADGTVDVGSLRQDSRKKSAKSAESSRQSDNTQS